MKSWCAGICVLLAGLVLSGRYATSAPANPQTPAAGAEVDFPTRILPILTKSGCNAGACHGAATGQGGFRLSLLGYDPEADHHAITRELAGRRIDLAAPAQSLMLRKATRDIRHKGGLRIEAGSADHRALINWLEAGAPYGPRDLRITRIHVDPADALFQRPSQFVQLRVTATLSDGSSRDVTPHALFTSSDEAIARAGPDGSVTAQRRGQTSIMVRFGGQVAAARVGLPFADEALDESRFPPARNFIDWRVWDELKRMRIPPSPVAADDEFLRRVFLDLIGRLPTPDEARVFLSLPSTPVTRDRLITELLAKSEFVDLWTLRLADLLLIDSKRLGAVPARAYHDWLRWQVGQRTPIDQVVRELLTATGDGATSGPANFHRLTQDPRDMGEYVSSALLGVQIACARCHAHPFASWTQDDYYEFAAFFARTRFDGGRVSVAPHGEVQHPKTGKDVAPRLLGGQAVAADADRRAALADWVTSPNNPHFARAFVNRVWRHLLGRGIVEPADDLRDSNPPSNPALLDSLAADFVRSGYDLRGLIQLIAESQTYRLSSRANDDNRADDRLFSHALVRPMPAQVLADAVADATGVADEHPGYPAGTRAVQLIDARTPSYALDVLGRCTRDTSCDTRIRGGGLSQALHLINGATINAKLRGGVIDRFLQDQATDEYIVDDLYLRTLTRFPSNEERTHFTRFLGSAKDRREAVEDLLWALLNSREFAFNH